MKVFISADIEGTAVTATREGCRPGEFEYERSRKEMTAEVVAAAEGARAAGAELVVVKDAHGPGLNILPEELPEYVQLIRSWSGSPEMMVEGLDSSFDAAFFVGYHNAAGREATPEPHHQRRRGSSHHRQRAARLGVPDLQLDGRLVWGSKRAPHGRQDPVRGGGRSCTPPWVTVPVKDDVGGRSQGLSPVLAHRRIREGAERAVKQDLSAARITLPEHFRVELTYRSHRDAYTKGFYPGAERVDAMTLAYETGDWYEANRFLLFAI